MTDKEMIEEMAQFIPSDIVRYDGIRRGQHLYIEQKDEIAKSLYEQGYRKIPEGSVVLSKEEAGEIKQIKKEIAEQAIESEKLKKNIAEAVNSFIRLETLYKIKCKELELAEEKSRKEMAREILPECTHDKLKQFAERLKEMAYKSTDWSHGEHPLVVEVDYIDEVLEEFTDD